MNDKHKCDEEKDQEKPKDISFSSTINELEVEFDLAVKKHRNGAIWWYIAVVACFVITFTAAIDFERLSRLVSLGWNATEYLLRIEDTSSKSVDSISTANSLIPANSSHEGRMNSLPAEPSETAFLIDKLSRKSALLGLLATVTIWCARHLRIQKHLQTVNERRVRTLHLVKALLLVKHYETPDSQTRDEIVKEMLQAVVMPISTGYLLQQESSYFLSDSSKSEKK